MKLNKLILRSLAALLFIVILCVQVGAIPLIGSANIYSMPGIDSKITVGRDLSEEDAAMRLYYLGILNGSGTNTNGSIEFALDRGLNRVEAAVFAVRLLGAEGEALKKQYSHPFTDVPAWASDYVGYIYNSGLLSNMEGELFEPAKAETAERFMSYMLYALGYRMAEKDYTYYMAAEYANGIGITNVSSGEPLTRGSAVLAMYNTLRTSMKDSTLAFSYKLVKCGAISYNDALFLIWCKKADEVQKYIDAMGYGSEWVIPDGFYKIKEHGSGMMLNVAVNGRNSDYEGVAVTLWEDTDDVTQTFRVERTERGTYYIYSAASRNGYGRVLGTADGTKLGLYSSTSRHAEEFYIDGDASGYWTITPANSKNLTLTYNDTAKNGARVAYGESTSRSASTVWEFERQGAVNSSGKALAIFVADSLLVTQGAYDVYSHQRQNAIDITPIEQAVYAPFDATVVRIDANYTCCNAVWIQSQTKVLYADGTYDYMTVCFMHDNYIGDLSVGMGIAQGEYFYDAGDYGVSSGRHVHVAVYRGQYNNTMRVGNGDVRIENALFLPDTTYVYNGYGLDWKFASLAD